MEFFKKIKCIALMTFRMNWKFNLKFSYIQSKNIYLDIIENKEKGIIFAIKDEKLGLFILLIKMKIKNFIIFNMDLKTTAIN